MMSAHQFGHQVPWSKKDSEPKGHIDQAPLFGADCITPWPGLSQSSHVTGGLSEKHGSDTPYDLSTRDLAVLKFVSDFRIVTAVQLQRLYFPAHRHATELTAIRASRRTFERLVRDGFLARLERRVGGARSGSASYCYVLGEYGSEALGLPKRRRAEPSLPFVRHVLAVSELATRLIEETDLDKNLVVQTIETETTCWRQFMGLGGGVDIVKPDLYVQLAVASSDDDQGISGSPLQVFDELHWFIEVDRGTEHRPAIQKKLRAYERYYRSGNGEGSNQVFPKVLWSVSAGTKTAQRTDQLRMWISQTSGITRELFVVKEFDESIKELKGGEL